MLTEDIVSESVGYKLRWLARELRWLNDPSVIQEWVQSVSSLTELLRKLESKSGGPQTRDLKRRNDPRSVWKKKPYLSSAQRAEKRRVLSKNMKHSIIPECQGTSFGKYNMESQRSRNKAKTTEESLKKPWKDKREKDVLKEANMKLQMNLTSGNTGTKSEKSTILKRRIRPVLKGKRCLNFKKSDDEFSSTKEKEP